MQMGCKVGRILDNLHYSKFISLAPALADIAYLTKLFILQLTHAASSVRHLTNY